MTNSIKHVLFVSVPIFIVSIFASYFAYLVYEVETELISTISEEIKIIISASIVAFLLSSAGTTLTKRIYNIGNKSEKTSILWFHIIFAVEATYYFIFSNIVHWLLPKDIPAMLLPFSIIMCTGWGYALMTKIWESRGSPGDSGSPGDTIPD